MTMSRRHLSKLFWILAAIAVVIVVTLRRTGGSQQAATVTAASGPTPEAGTGTTRERNDQTVPREGSRPPLGEPSVTARPDQRVEALTPILIGRVRSQVGGSLQGAVATWAPWTSLDLSSQTPWFSDRYVEGIQGIDTVVEGTTYSFWRRPSGHSRSFVYVTDPDHLASAVSVNEDQTEPLTLESAEPVRVRAVNGVGHAVEGAVVTSRGWARLGNEVVPLFRRYITDVEGFARVSPLPNPSFMRAEHEGRASEVWRGEHSDIEGAVTLVLWDTFAAMGRVGGAPSQIELDQCEVLVRKAHEEDAWARGRAQWHTWIASAPVSKTGTWDLPQVAWLGDSNYVFRIQGPATSPMEVVYRVSTPEQRVNIDFDWQAGHLLELRLADESDIPIPGALVVAAWKGIDGAWTRYDTLSNTEGHARFTNCPEVMLWVRAYAEGFANQAFGPFVIPVESGSFPLVLVRSGLVRGKCTHAGEPVERFTVTYWGDDPSGRSAQTFDSPNGRFELTDVPQGTVHLFARSDDLPSSPILATEGTRATEVELELPDPMVARGRVVDSSSGEPLPRVRLEVHGHVRNRMLEAWGPPAFTDSTGVFTELILSPSTDTIEVSLDTYSTVYVTRDLFESGEVDLGLIALTKLQDLTVQLVSERPMSFEGFRVGLFTGPAEEVTPQGRIVIGDVAAHSNYQVYVYPPGGGRIDVDVTLLPGRDWECEVLVGTSRSVVVTIEPADGVEVPEDLWVAVSHRDRLGKSYRCIVEIDEFGVSRLNHVSGDRAVIQGITSTGQVVATKAVSLPEADEVRVTLPLSGREVELLFLDTQDQPVTSAGVFIRIPDDPVGTEIGTRTDETGRIRLIGFQADEVDIVVSPDYFKHASIKRLKLLEEEPTVVRVDLGARVRARLVENGLPAAGISISLLDVGETERALDGNSDSDGLVDLPFLSPGPYQLRIEGDGYWPLAHPIEASSNPTPQRIEVRRIGSVELRVTQESLPVHGLQLEVISNEDACSVAEWLESGLALSGEQGLVTDSTGTVVLKGLPNGSYTWRIHTGSGTMQGQFEVAPLKLTHVPIALPP